MALVLLGHPKVLYIFNFLHKTFQPAIAMALTTTDLKGTLPLLARGKVRDVYQLNDNSLLFVATDRISAYDVIMKNVSSTLLIASHPQSVELIWS